LLSSSLSFRSLGFFSKKHGTGGSSNQNPEKRAPTSPPNKRGTGCNHIPIRRCSTFARLVNLRAALCRTRRTYPSATLSLIGEWPHSTAKSRCSFIAPEATAAEKPSKNCKPSTSKAFNTSTVVFYRGENKKPPNETKPAPALIVHFLSTPSRASLTPTVSVEGR